MSEQEEQRKRGDIRLAVEQLLREHPEMRQKEIAARIGCTQGFVSTVRRVNIASGKIVLPAERVDALGRKRPTSYSGKKETEAAGAAPYQIENPSECLRGLMKYWRKARKQEREDFSTWIKEEQAQTIERDGNGNPTR